MAKPSTSPAALDAIGLSKSYEGVAAVTGVTLHVRSGEVHGLLGPNGAGKTTVLRMVLGLVTPDAGSIRLLGRTAGAAGRFGGGGVAGFVDAPKFYPYLSGRRNLSLLARLDGTSGTRVRDDAVTDALRAVGLDAKAANLTVAGYSAGMCQRLGLASALLRSPQLLVLDEPTNSLDPEGARELRDHVRRLAGDGVAVLLSSHDMREVEEVCSTVTIVHQSHVVFSGTIAELLDQAPAAAHRLSTSDDERAVAVAEAHSAVEVTALEGAASLEVVADQASLDRYVIALGQVGIAVRSLESHDRSLEARFLGLTAPGRSAPRGELLGSSAPTAVPAADEGSVRSASVARGVAHVVQAELAKLAVQAQTWAILAVSVLGPFAFVMMSKLQSALPEDTLFGRWVRASGFAAPLVVLGFAGAWALPVAASVVGGDLFSSEDRHGTWPTLLTRSRTRDEIFAGKVVTALVFSLAAVLATALASIVAGALLVGRQPLIGLSGTEVQPAAALRLVALAWGSVLPPTFAFTGLALLTSIATRSSAAGVGLPVLAALAMQLTTFVDGLDVLRRLTLAAPFVAWHGLFAVPAFHRPLVEGTTVSVVYLAGSVALAYLLFRRREIRA